MPRPYRNFGEVRDGLPYDTEGRLIEACIQSVPDGGRFVTSHNCDRKLKGDAEYPHLCGLHISAIRRAKDRENKRLSEKIQRNEEFETATQELIELNGQLGITSILETRAPQSGPEAWIYRPTGNAIVPVEKLKGLAGRIAQLESQLNEAHRLYE